MALSRVYIRPMKLVEVNGRVVARGGLVRAGEVKIVSDRVVTTAESTTTYMVGLDFTSGRIKAVKRGAHE